MLRPPIILLLSAGQQNVRHWQGTSEEYEAETAEFVESMVAL